MWFDWPNFEHLKLCPYIRMRFSWSTTYHNIRGLSCKNHDTRIALQLLFPKCSVGYFSEVPFHFFFIQNINLSDHISVATTRDAYLTTHFLSNLFMIVWLRSSVLLIRFHHLISLLRNEFSVPLFLNWTEFVSLRPHHQNISQLVHKF